MPFVLLGLAILLMVLGLVMGYRKMRQWRLVEALPTSKVQGVFIGLVEVKGEPVLEPPLHSYLARCACVHYAYTVQEHWSRTVTEHYTDSNGRSQTRTRHESGWTTMAQGGLNSAFYLRDDTGAILVWPEGAEIEPLSVFNETCGRGDPLYYGKGPPGSCSHSDHRRRFTEVALPLGHELFVIGPARERADVVAAEIAAEKDAERFLISTRQESQIISGHRTAAILWPLFGVIAAGGTAATLAGQGRGQPLVEGGYGAGADLTPFFAIGGVLVYVLACVFLWLWAVYNSLVDVRARLRRGKSLIDVELKRRSDLITRLVSCVEGYVGHERGLQEHLARLRTQARATAPGLPGDDPVGVAPSLRVISEAYPELKADRLFVQLQDELVTTENRIALARGYFNDIVERHNTQIMRFPDSFWAKRCGFKEEPHLTGEGFERAAPVVNFSVPS